MATHIFLQAELDGRKCGNRVCVDFAIPITAETEAKINAESMWQAIPEERLQLRRTETLLEPARIEWLALDGHGRWSYDACFFPETHAKLHGCMSELASTE